MASPVHTYGAQTGRPTLPAGAVPQVPREPATSHASHAAAHAVPQHTPSTQKPLPHCAARPQTPPAANLGTQEVPLQKWVAAQALSAEQPVGQLAVAPSQRYGAHEGAPTLSGAAGLQVPTRPARSQTSQAPAQGTSQQTPSAQDPLAHWFAPAQAAPAPFFGTHALPSQYEVATHRVSSAHDEGHPAAPPQT